MAMQESSTRSIYDFHSLFYDVTFGRLVRRRITSAISHMNIRPGQRVLDMGIGTGALLDYYPRHARIFGIDLSGGMLRECRKKIQHRRLAPTALFQANALQLPFRDDAFDHVFISHVISVVSDPYRLIRESQRVAKPGRASSSSTIFSPPTASSRWSRNSSARCARSWVVQRPAAAGPDPHNRRRGGLPLQTG